MNTLDRLPDPPLSEAMVAVADLMIALGKAPLNKYPGPVIYDVDKHWKIVLNPHSRATKYGAVDGIEIPPFHCYIEWNGWPAGLISPYGGAIVGGSLANEESFITAVRGATPK